MLQRHHGSFFNFEVFGSDVVLNKGEVVREGVVACPSSDAPSVGHQFVLEVFDILASPFGDEVEVAVFGVQLFELFFQPFVVVFLLLKNVLKVV